jgi:argininosuccinate lyase
MVSKRTRAAVVGACLAGACATGAAAETRDAFFFISEMNKASAVMVASTGIVDRKLGKTIAQSVAKVIEEGARAGAERSPDYLRIEAGLISAGGPDVTRLHSGRSRQDMASTTHRLFLRDAYLDNAATLNDYRAALLRLARQTPDAVMPAYTMGVQAQPITLGHYLSGYAGALERQADRLREAYARVNLSPLGAAAVGTSSFPVDRKQLATALGFDAPVENSFDANHVSPFDTSIDAASVAIASAVTTGALMADLLGQYRQARPWFMLAAGATTTSSIMPQKRNPTSMLDVRKRASHTIGAAETAILLTHNVTAGVREYRDEDARDALCEATQMQAAAARLVATLEFNVERAHDEVAAEYSTTTELADVLQREADVPFRVGHHFASELVNYGRAHALRPAGLPFDEVKRIYTATAKEMLGQDNAAFPLSEARFRESLTAENMVRSSRGLGGPQPQEVERMLKAQLARLAADRAWLDGRRKALADASTALDTAFNALRSE